MCVQLPGHDIAEAPAEKPPRAFVGGPGSLKARLLAAYALRLYITGPRVPHVSRNHKFFFSAHAAEI